MIFKGKPINALQEFTHQVVLDTCYRVADDHRTSTFNYELFGTTTLNIYHDSYSIAGNYYVDIDPTHLSSLVDRELTTKYYVDNQKGTRQPTIDTDTDLSCNTITTTGNIDVGGLILAPNQPSFKVSPSITETITGTGAGINLPYDVVIYDTTNSYNNTNYEYTIPVAGNYFFYYPCGITADTEYAISLRKNDVVIDRSIILDVSLLTNDYDTQGGKGMAVTNCIQGDIIKVTCNGATRSCSISYSGFGVVNSFGGFLIG